MSSLRLVRHRFEGTIAGLGSTGGTRVVLGAWPASPFGSFADVMVERADGHRLLLAPDQQVADFVQATYTFDEVRLVAVDVQVDGPVWRVAAGPLALTFTVGRCTSAAGAAAAGRPGAGRLEPGVGVGGGPGRAPRLAGGAHPRQRGWWPEGVVRRPGPAPD